MDFDWLKQHWWAAVLYLGSIIGSVIGENILSSAIKDQTINDIAVSVLVISAMLSPIVYLIVREFRQPRLSHAGVIGGSHVVVASAPTAPSAAPITGETTVALVRTTPETNPETMDYYATSYTTRAGEYRMAYTELSTLSNLKLGEMALIRRLGVAPNQRETSARCRAVLQNSGIAHPESSIAKLEDLELIQTASDVISLVEGGRRFVYLSSQLLTHDPGLVSAYRQITPNINRSIRFDRRPLGN